MNSSNFLSPLFLIIYLCIGFIPNWGAVDKIAPQWLGMNILNGLVVLYIFFNRKYFLNALSKTLSSKLTLLYGFFILWAAGSFFYAINQTEQLVNITRQLNIFLMYCCMLVLLSSVKYKITFLSWVLSAILTIEIYYVLVQALDMINTNGMISSGSLKGVTANRNITAFSLAIKMPFVYYLLYTNKKTYLKIVLALLSFSVFLGLSMIQSRASFLATGFGIIAFLGGLVFIGFKTDSKKELKRIILSALGVLVPLVFALTINQTILKDKGADAISRAASIGAVTTDDSITARIRYYTDVFNQIKSSPIFGVGLGNWKLKSIDFDKYDINGYVVPYHAHSDFIQLGAELGIIGFISYLGIFFMAIFFAYRYIKNSSSTLEQRLFIFLLLVSLGIYSVDASLNFPIARPQVLVVWTLVMSLLSFYYYEQTEQQPKKKVSTSFLLLSIVCLLPSLFVSNSVYKSLKGQMYLLSDFNSNKYSIAMNDIDDIVPNIPNITVTTIPLKSVKARYYINAKQYDRALELLNEGTNANPYLHYSELLKSQIYSAKGQLDSAMYFAQTAFFGLPNNSLHSATYLNLISQLRDQNALDEAFELLTAKGDFNNWKNYLIIANNIMPKGDLKTIERAKEAVRLFPTNSDIKSLFNTIAIGQENINEAQKLSNLALTNFNQQDYVQAAANFEKAIALNPYEYAFYENAATSNYLTGDLNKALEQIDKVINEMNPLNGKCEYIKALIFIKMGDPIGACPLLATSRDSGYGQAEGTFDQYCKN